MEEDQIREYLNKLDKQQSVGPNEMHSQVLRELADVILRALSVVFERSWWLGGGA